MLRKANHYHYHPETKIELGFTVHCVFSKPILCFIYFSNTITLHTSEAVYHLREGVQIRINEYLKSDQQIIISL